jgi:hypothetical protein
LLEAEAKEKLVAKTPLGVPWIEPEAVAQDKLMLVHRPPLVRLSKRAEPMAACRSFGSGIR